MYNMYVWKNPQLGAEKNKTKVYSYVFYYVVVCFICLEGKKSGNEQDITKNKIPTNQAFLKKGCIVLMF